MDCNILQWNVRSIRKRFCDIQLLLMNVYFSVMAFQETWLLDADVFTFRRYNVLRKNRPNGVHGGGVCLLILALLTYSVVLLNTPLEAVAATVVLPKKKITVCSLYISPNTPLDKADLKALIQQLPRPFLLLGDFNAKHSLWGSPVDDVQGRTVVEVMLEENLVLLNSGYPTHISDATGQASYFLFLFP